MARKLTNKENEKVTWQDLEYGGNTEQRANEKHNTVGTGKWQETVKNVKNVKYTMQVLPYGQKTNKRGT